MDFSSICLISVSPWSYCGVKITCPLCDFPHEKCFLVKRTTSQSCSMRFCHNGIEKGSGKVGEWRANRGSVADMQHPASDTNRPFGARKSLEPSLILTGERLNDTGCSSLRTWCRTDANLLAGDVLLRPFPSHAPLFNSLALLLPHWS